MEIQSDADKDRNKDMQSQSNTYTQSGRMVRKPAYLNDCSPELLGSQLTVDT